MTPYDLLMLIHEKYCNCDIEDTIVEINNLVYELGIENKYIDKLLEELEILALSEFRCMICGSKLEFVNHTEKREYLGREVEEEMCHLECSDYSCSYTQ